jgi:hypothetical protein
VLIIFGFRIRAKTVETRDFYCPGCGGDRVAHKQVLRRWFTLFFIPLIPLGEVGEVVACATCGRAYGLQVLTMPTVASLASAMSNAQHALAVMIVATGDTTDAALRARAVAAVSSVNPGYTDETLARDLIVVDTSFASAYVAPLAEKIEVPGRERFLQDLLAIAGPSPTPAQLDLVREAGRGLNLTVAHVTGILATSSVPGSATPFPTHRSDGEDASTEG